MPSTKVSMSSSAGLAVGALGLQRVGLLGDVGLGLGAGLEVLQPEDQAVSR